MPIPSYAERETYVAVLDISGFKEMMKRGIKAEEALNKFYNTVYSVQRNFLRICKSRNDLLPVNTIVVSDCVVLFSRNSRRAQDKVKGLRSILEFIQRVNCRLVTSISSPAIMTTCSIAYGKFKYEDRIEIKGITKDYFVGWSYVKAFEDNEYGEPRIRPVECRILRDNLSVPESIHKTEDPILSLLKKTRKYYYFYWMLGSPDDLKSFKREYKDAYRLKGQLRYTGVISVLQKYVRRTHT